MGLALKRLRDGEWLALAGVIVMVIALLGLHWYGGPPPRTGWGGATHLRWLLLLAIALGAAIVLTQAACRSPALPASLDVLAVVVTLLALLWLVFRVVLDPGRRQLFGAWLELIGTAILFVGSFRALRREGILERDGPGEVPLVDLRGSHLESAHDA